MGKGKGKLAGWSCEVPAGLTIVELRNLRPGRAAYFCTQLKHKIPAFTQVITSRPTSQRYTHLVLNPHIRVSKGVVW